MGRSFAQLGQCWRARVLASERHDDYRGHPAREQCTVRPSTKGNPEGNSVTTEDPHADATLSASDSGEPEPFTAAAADARMLKIPLIWVSVAGTIATIISAILFGEKGLIAGVLGTLVVMGFFGGGQYIVARVLRNNPMVAMNMAMLVYVGQMAIMLVLLLLLQDATFFNAKAFAITVVACIFVWTGAMAYSMMRTKILYVEPGSGPGQPY